MKQCPCRRCNGLDVPDESETDEERAEREDRESEAALERHYAAMLNKENDDGREAEEPI